MLEFRFSAHTGAMIIIQAVRRGNLELRSQAPRRNAILVMACQS
jgi:hypothetical protein